MALSLKTKEHILRAAALLVPKWGALLGGGAALALSIGFTGSALHFTTVTDTHGGRVHPDSGHRPCHCAAAGGNAAAGRE